MALKFGTAGDDSIAGTSGDDTIWGDSTGTNSPPEIGSDTINGGDGVDIIRSFGGDDQLGGGNGNDVLDGGDGNDTLNGGDGNDDLYGGAGDDRLEGGDDFERAHYDNAASAVTVSLAISGPQNTGGAGIDTLIAISELIGSAYGDVLTGGNDTGRVYRLSGQAGNDFLFAGTGNQSQLRGGFGNDFLIGSNSQYDSLLGEDGDDTIDGGAGQSDRINGGDGVDTASYASAPSAVIVRLDGFGVDEFGYQDTGGAGRDNLDSIENLTGSAYGDTLIGSQGANVLEGRFGNDSIYGQGGDDVVRGGPDNDILDGGPGIDTVSFAAASSGVVANLSQATGGDGTDSLTNFENLTGSSFNDVLTSDNGANILQGHAGLDHMDGGIGIDTLLGGTGNDTYVLRDVHRTDFFAKFIYDAVNENAGEGIDTVEIQQAGSTGGYLLPANVERGIVIGVANFDLSGNNLANHLTGNAADNRLDGGIGADTLAGGRGTDTLLGSEGNDTASGAGGIDLLIGGGGYDVMTGGNSRDVFDFNNITDSGLGSAARDVITDLVHLVDRIDLSTIDAIDGGSDDSFTFIGGAVFSAAGQVRATQAGADTSVAINTIGASGPEMIITLADFTASVLTAGDFIL